MTNPNQWSQHSQRLSTSPNESGKFWRDQHGRDWHSEVELRTGDPCGPLRLARPADAPYVPDSNFITIVKGRRGQDRLDYDIEINYAALRANIADGWTMYQAEMQRERGRNPQLSAAELVAKVGKPKFSPRIVDLMEEGNPYLLGLAPFDASDPVHTWAREMIHPLRVRTYHGLDDGFPAPEESPPAKRGRGRPRKEVVLALAEDE